MAQATLFPQIRIMVIAIFAWLSVHGVAYPHEATLEPFSSSMPEHLRARIETAGLRRATMRGEVFLALSSLARFYERRAYQPVWICDEGLLPHADALVHWIRQVEYEGIRPSNDYLSRIEALTVELRRHGTPEFMQTHRSWVDLELLLTDAFFTYGAHLLTGQIDPHELKEVWLADRPEIDLTTALQQALETNHIAEFLHDLRPVHAGYAGLRKALTDYHTIAAKGGWPAIADGPKLQRGDRGPRVAALRKRLMVTRDLEPASDGQDGDVFDAALERGLQRFQERHGLDADGVVGASTSLALNVPVEARIRQIKLNMERWRWLPRELGDRYILVNIANFALDVIEHGQSALTMRVVVGKPARRTPFLSATMAHLVLSPHWYVPPTIAIQDKLPLIRRDPGYAARQNLGIFREGAAGATRVDPMSINWSSVSARHFPFKLRQDPGPRNALGRVKFMFPNPYHVYLHDTPSRELFAEAERAFSSGCIRLEKPIELAEYLLKDDPRWTRQRMLTIIEKRTEQIVSLPTPLPVYLLYWTAWVSEGEILHFRKDIYERDKILEKELLEVFPSMKRRDNAEMQ